MQCRDSFQGRPMLLHYLNFLAHPCEGSSFIQTSKQNPKAAKPQPRGQGMCRGIYLLQVQLFQHLHVPYPPPSSQPHGLRCDSILKKKRKKEKCCVLINYLSSVVCGSSVSLNGVYINTDTDVCIPIQESN